MEAEAKKLAEQLNNEQVSEVPVTTDNTWVPVIDQLVENKPEVVDENKDVNKKLFELKKKLDSMQHRIDVILKMINRII